MYWDMYLLRGMSYGLYLLRLMFLRIVIYWGRYVLRGYLLWCICRMSCICSGVHFSGCIFLMTDVYSDWSLVWCIFIRVCIYWGLHFLGCICMMIYTYVLGWTFLMVAISHDVHFRMLYICGGWMFPMICSSYDWQIV